ncbi:MAG: hypothetical protein MUF21_12860 [Gemmatimonadaceae bacterium]|jgi:hypothetical protein|nr:hypothetical protein [Gemmatimonadaceae bacterium]
MLSARAALLATALPLVVACSDGTGPGSERLLFVSRLDAPATFIPRDSVRISLAVGTGACVGFARLDSRQRGDTVVVRAIGLDRSGPGVSCTDLAVATPTPFAVASGDRAQVVFRVERRDSLPLSAVVRAAR